MDENYKGIFLTAQKFKRRVLVTYSSASPLTYTQLRSKSIAKVESLPAGSACIETFLLIFCVATPSKY